jgi:hypothetical protein
MVKSCVFFAVRTEFLNIIQTSFDFKVNDLKYMHSFFLALTHNFAVKFTYTYFITEIIFD